jgi:hypothetical protein
VLSVLLNVVVFFEVVGSVLTKLRRAYLCRNFPMNVVSLFWVALTVLCEQVCIETAFGFLT